MKPLYLLCFTLISFSVFSQQTSPYTKFGKISVEELQKKYYGIDSGANAVVLSDVGEASIEGNSKGWFSVLYKRHRVVHILNKNGFDEADVRILLYSEGEAEEKLEDIKGVTYNLENGKIQESKLDKSSVFKEKIDKNHVVRKFTMPNVKDGCIIEFQYQFTSDYYQILHPWYFQGGSPVLWSEYTLSVPQFFTYAFLSHGYQPMYINDQKDRVSTFTVMDSRSAEATDRFSFNSGITDYRWVMKDVPEIKEESFTSAIKNHLSAIEFQLSSQSMPLQPHDYRNTWSGLTQSLLSSDYFGSGLKNNNNWLSDEVTPVILGAHSQVEKAQRIFSYVRDNFTCTEHNALYAEQSLKNTLKSKKGTVSEINLLLTAMLRHAGISADPVIVSTTNHGYALEMYPMLTSFNYVIVKAMADGNDYYLDASHSRLGFNHLLPSCYNGHARVVEEAAPPVYFYPDSLRERSLTSVLVSNVDKGGWQGVLKQTPGYVNSYYIRDEIKEKGKEEFFKKVEKDLGNEAKIDKPHIDSLDQYDFPVAVQYDLNLPQPKEDIFYFNPMFGEGYKTNPFKSAVRYYPVEMPYTMDENYLLTMEVPDGYVVDELPKQMIAKMDEKESAYFEYRISLSGNTISMRTRIKINRTLYLPEEYDVLREFFNVVVKKQNEQIVFKKKKQA
ncbi:MAG: transglutaminase domain-containing protein [Flavisolibacter sp.]